MVTLYPQSPASKCLKAIAATLCQETPEPEADGGMEFFWEHIADRKTDMKNG
jgi:MinD-like ATPase involved in chromosome partitioning or flagellar assembly